MAEDVSPIPFSDPEAAWDVAAPLLDVDINEVERRLGATTAAMSLLPGGRANLNIRVGTDRVLRIYRRDRTVAAKERALLQLSWTSFVVPSVLKSGDDFLVLEYLAHGALDGTAEYGRHVGAALAEIHRRHFADAGFLDGGLIVGAPFTDVVETLTLHARSELERAVDSPGGTLRARVLAFLRARRDTLRSAAGPPVLLHGDFKASNLHRIIDGRLLVLDWEFAYSGPALMDVGQLLRWHPPEPFVSAFAGEYCENGGTLPDDWRRLAGTFDLFNLVSLLASAPLESRRRADVVRRIEQTMSDADDLV